MNLDIAFDILHVDENCSYEELVVAYRAHVKIYHPDHNAHQQDFAHRTMSRVNEAFEIAKDYLSSLPDESEQGPVVPEEEEPAYDFTDLFEVALDDMLGGSRSSFVLVCRRKGTNVSP